MSDRDRIIIALYEKGMTMREVGAVVGVSAMTVHDVLRRYQVPSRARGPRKSVA